MGFIYCKLRILMAEQNLNIQKVKDNTTLSRTTISNLYNNNGAGVQFETLGELCELLKCDPGDLFKYVDVSVDFYGINHNDRPYELVTDKLTYKNKKAIPISDNEVTLNMICRLNYKEQISTFEFQLNLQFHKHKSSKSKLNVKGVTSPSYKSSVSKLDLPTYIEEYFIKKLKEFIDEWTLRNYDVRETHKLSTELQIANRL
ncbi:helix-turn-helix protein [Oceanobacillus picturae]|uniref:Helix-turn-helix protein n=2 Tax=Oceanobacillus picturae TaxID=171693 RepID=A0A0U9H8Y8_9BACI|nr:helix-turn-helix transcriptional regulator [Oceanobacillus picturae]GAQ19139.1 helix-turn-helix protein [Oceanobacillus picturae]